MDNKNDTMEFDLEDILTEFHDYAADMPEDSADAFIGEDIAALPDIPDLASPSALEEDPELNLLLARDISEVLSGETLRFDPVADSGKQTAEEILSQEPTTQIPELPTLEAANPEQETKKDPVVSEDDTFVASAPIVFTPKSRLRELKKKLVAGPEKRYYELEGQGLGSLQMAILINMGLVALCAAMTAMFALDMMSENRLRLVIFTQVLAMMVSGLTGCNLMLDSLAELFKGRFTLNTLLVLTFGACFVDGIFCLMELRIPCCAAFCLEMTMALWARYHRHTTEMAQMDTMRKAVRLHGIVKVADYFNGLPGLLRTEAEVEDFMDHYQKMAGPELVQSIYAAVGLILSMAVAILAALFHGLSMGVQILATSLLVAVPASFFVSVTRPMALLENRLHMVGSVLCGWKGVKGLCGKAAFPLSDTDLFPQGSTKLNGVKFYSDRDPDEVVAYTTALITKAGGGLVPVFQHLLTSRNGKTLEADNFQNYGNGGIGGEVNGEPVLLGGLNFLQDMGVSIPEGTMVNQAVYAAIDGQLCAVYAMTYAKMRSAAAGLVTLCGYRKLTPVMLCGDFTVTESFLRGKFNIKTRRMVFPSRDERAMLGSIRPDPECRVLAITTREELVSSAYLVTGARSLRLSTNLAVTIHLIGGIVGLLIMLALAILGNTELLTPTNILLYQLIWAIPGLLVTEWTRIV
ncbi:MAG: hypothetical protein J6V25_06535 [Oscillospiraceae bacterium]|nr:hypothetical protein [Oscillospiraceae bacterium]